MATVKQLRLGVIGLSEGNGHPYSWAAIFNGYDEQTMAECPFPVIPQYLGEQAFPDDAIPDARVTHIWTQEREISEHVAAASLIDNIVDDYANMASEVDALLLARDDAETHEEMSRPFLEAGLPVFIDKPIATSLDQFDRILAMEQYPGQVFSCSALRYAKEMRVAPRFRKQIGNIRHVHATVPKYWHTYGVHIIEPVLMALGNDRGAIHSVNTTAALDKRSVTVTWQTGVTATFETLGDTHCPLAMTLYGDRGFRTFNFRNTFASFKASLVAFVRSVRTRKPAIPAAEMREIVDIIEQGIERGNHD